MVLPVGEDVRAVLEESHGPDSYTVSAFYGPDLTVAEVPITADGEIVFDGDAVVQGKATLYLAKDSESLVPRSQTDPLAPFGQEVSITRNVVNGGGVVGSIPMGRFRITKVPDMKEYFARYPTQLEMVGWTAQLEVKDRFEAVDADDFIQATGPEPGNTVWEEIQRLSPFPVVRSLPDKTVPAGTSYSSRIGALQVLATVLGGKLHMTRQGAITVRPANPWMTETEPQFVVNGTIRIDRGMSNDLRNQVQITSNVGGNELVAVARITDESNPLAVTRMGGRTYRDSLPLDTQAALDAAALTTLQRVSTRQAERVRFTALPRPDLEVGDFGRVNDLDTGGWVLGEIASMRFPLDPTAPMTGEIVAAETHL